MAKHCYFCESKIAARDAVQTIGEQVYVLTTSNSRKAVEFTEIIRDIFESNDFTVSCKCLLMTIEIFIIDDEIF